MQDQGFFYQALIYLLAAVISVPIAKRLGLGSVLGYLLAGIVIGPFVLGLIGEEGEDLMHFAEFGVVMMLFLIGLELRPSLLWKMKRSIFGLGGLQMIISTVLIAAIALFFKQKLHEAVIIGLILAISSTAIILQTLVEKGEMNSAAGKSAFSVLLFQDIAVIPILALIPVFAIDSGHSPELLHGESVNTIAGFEISGWVQVGLVLFIITGIGFTGRFLARHIFRIIAKTGLREIFTATALLIVVAISVVMEWVGLSPALGAFLGGVVLADSEYRHELEMNIEPFKGLLLGLFFLAVGASIDFNLFLEQPYLVLGLLAILVSVKFIVLFLLGRFFGLRGGKNTLFAFALAQGGEFAFVLISFSLQNNVLTADTSGLLLIVVALSMALSPLLLLINEKVVKPAIEKGSNVKQPDDIKSEGNDVVIIGFGRFGITIGRLLRANGFNATILDDNPDNIQVLRKFGIKVFYGDATRQDLLHAAGCDTAKIMILAIDDEKKALAIVDYAKKAFPHLKILARAVSKRHGYEYMKRDIVFEHDMFNSSLHLGIHALKELGFRPYQAIRATRLFRHQNKQTEQELFKHYEEDEKKYILETHRLAAQLMDLLQTEQENPIHASDTAWDVSTRKEDAIVASKKQDDGKDKPTNPEK
ncbi:monovalent cation:proton antiporter-2 (CPA2) family protein [Bacteroidota bacterium]